MNWTRGRAIGRGASATVFAAAWSDSGEVFAVKSAEVSRSEFLERERAILSSLESPWIVGYKGCDVTREEGKEMFNLMMEFMPGGNLLDGIRVNGGRLKEPEIGYYTEQILRGLEFLHSRGVVHCDIKSRNVLLGESGAKIADFGCAKWVGDRRFAAAAAAGIGGTPVFMSPEAAQGKEQGFPADIWALGCTVIEMATGGGSPWPNATNPASILYHIAYSGESPQIPAFLSDEAKDFLEKCLKINPRDRWTAAQLLNHPFLQESNSIPKQNQNQSSPTSILDQGIWNSMEGEDLIRTPSSLDSPSGRVRRLWLGSPELAEWEGNEDSWTTVRGGEKESAGSVTAFSSNGMEVERCRCLSGDNLLLNYAVDDNVSCRSCCSTGTEQGVVVITTLNFERRKDISVKQLPFL
ncbi:PREDICTED: mitogen-activated protein kinase kinase kinase 2-like [Ipomoea nil]|uniref:mitogen-activated protein kinase kinase kinase 2-like n=1 Tax=Ipomoea nil TaxID=35883 RepID=UPI0009008CEB|nr:PREDICTED: mitogen-activated protein kinase kinase kinase 2-like [Ipomoea nil]